ncbi:DUF1003 domain-containing protein, partial [bacterium]
MTGYNKNISPCPACSSEQESAELMPLELVDGPLIDFITKKYPDLASRDAICLSCLQHIRDEYVKDLLDAETGELSALGKEAIQSVHEQELLTKNINREFEQQLTFGQRLADKIAEFGGSWTFILIFGGVLLTWITINSMVLLWRPFDPYPFILLNLVLSCLAAIQAPII